MKRKSDISYFKKKMTKGETELAGEQQHRAREEEEGEEEEEHDKGAQHQTAAGQELAAASVKEGQDKSKAAVPGPPCDVMTVTLIMRWMPRLENISQSRAEQPKQPHLKFFPRTLQGDRRRCFSKDWFNSHKWLEYSQDVQLLVVVKEEFLPDQQEWSTSLDQEDPESPPYIKQEQEELRISQEGEQLQELEEADIIKSTFTPDPVKSEIKRNLSPHSLIKDKLNTWKQKLMEMTVEDQNLPGTQFQKAVYNQRLRTTLETLLNLTLETHLNLTLKTVLIGRRPENLRQTQPH
ncbi:uncharacterized protein [Pseudochaenichthys georgianus]|uniref:uncharacterized protein n=1 Tax=Pseudochaenichthys georgianus TaxID=52239 RepID=UPI0039C47208